MKFVDLFVHRPVLASVLSLLLLILGFRGLAALEVREYPATESTIVTVTTVYPGAGSELVKGFITTPLQQAVAEAKGIDYLFATSTQGRSIIEAHMELGYDPNAAVAEIQAKVASQRGVLPERAEDPVIDSTTGETTALMYLAFFSETMRPSQITDYLLRVVQPKLQSVPGVAKAQIFGNKTFAMRIWLDPVRMAALDVTPGDVESVLRANNFLAAAGRTRGGYVSIDLDVTTDVSRVKDFEDLVIRSASGDLVRLRDVAVSELGAENYDTASWYNGKPAIFIGIEPTPGSNPLTVAERIHRRVPEIRRQLPSGLHALIAYDASTYIEDSIREVFRTLAEAVLIVLVVVFLSLGSVRAAIVPAVAVPLSLIGCGFLMLLLGFSLNLLTLLAMVLAIGLVVDDAIVVVENVHRHIQEGEAPVQAAVRAARELALPIVAMTTTLVAVYAPIGFMGGLVGNLFTEFAFTLAGAVLVSGVVALTLSPMLSSRVLDTAGKPGRFENAVDRFFTGLAGRYESLLHRVLNRRGVVFFVAIVSLGSIYFMLSASESELAPTEDQSILFVQARAPQTATIDYDKAYARQMLELFETFPQYEESFLILGQGGDPTTVFGGFKMPPTTQRSKSQMDLQPELQRKLDRVSGFEIGVFPRSSLPGSSSGLSVQFVVTTDADYRQLLEAVDELIRRASQSGKFAFITKSIQFSRPVTTIVVDRDRAGDLGVTMEEIGRNLAVMLSSRHVNRFNLEGRSYKVIPQVERRHRLNASMLGEYYIRTGTRELVPMSALVSFESSVEPSKRTQFQQLNSVTIEGTMEPGVTLGEALTTLEAQARDTLPEGFGWDYMGPSRQYVKEGQQLLFTFFLALIVIYLVLAAQFESWRDPLIILISVPMSIAGAMAFLALGFATVNIYTQVGLITLIGLMAKNGILIVEFANQLQTNEGLDKRRAVEKASRIRLRPVLMTTVSLAVAMIPLLMATGAGAVSRYHIGLVIGAGLSIGTVFTLFVVPAFYVLLGERKEAAET